MGTSPNQLSARRGGIIGMLLAVGVLLGALLGGCSALRVAYGTGPQLSWWWLDGYFDFDRQQAPPVKAALERWFDWHRQTQLKEVASTLVQAQKAVMEPTTPEQACRWNQRLRDVVQPAIDRAVLEAADLTPLLTEVQLKALEQRNAKSMEEMRRDFLQPDAVERQKASLKRTVERAEQLYGRLSEAQRRIINEGVAASPFDAQAWYNERLRRQRDTLQTLRQLMANKATGREASAARAAALRALLERTDRSPEPAYRAYQIKLTDYNCALSARVHNAAGPEQRRKARDNLKGWEEDLLAAAAAPAAGSDPSRQ